MIQSIRVILPLLLFATLSYSSAGAQANKHNGYMITLSGDTLQGFVLFTWKAEFTHSCKFKSEADTQLKTYQPDELKGFYVQNRLFESRNFPDGNSYFIETLVRGKMSLYRFQPKGNTEIYMVEKDTMGLIPLQEKIADTSLIFTGYVNRYELSDLGYKKVLFKLTSDCFEDNSLVENIDRLRLRYKSLVKYVVDYNACISAPVGYQHKPVMDFHAGLIGGWANYNASVPGNRFNRWLSSAISEPVQSFSGGVFMDFHLRNYNNRFFLRYEILYTHMKWEGVFINPDDLEEYKSLVKMTHIKMPLSLNYRLMFGKWQPSIYAGYSRRVGLNLIMSNSRTGGIPNYRFATYSFLGGLGLIYPISPGIALLADLRLESGNFLINGRLNHNLRTTNVRMGIRF